MRYLAIDHGQKRTGLAVSDASETLVSPYSVIETQKEDELLKRVIAVIDDEKIDVIVLGLPFNMDGTEGPRAKKVRAFGESLLERISIPILFHDERLSSFAAEQLVIGLELTRKKKKKRLDAIAAAEILKSFLNTKKNG